MDSYRILTIIHILAVLVAFGPTFLQPLLMTQAEKSGVAATRLALSVTQKMERFMTWPGVAIVAVTGAFLIFNDVTNYNDDFPRWLEISIAWFVVAVLVAFYLSRLIARAIKILTSVPESATLPPEYEALSKRMSMVGGLLHLSVVGILVLMVLGRTGAF
jgi:uncharacterized membrane protein